MLLRVDVFLAAETELGAEGMATLAPALGNLVSLTSLNLTGSYAPFVKPWCILEGWHGDVEWVVTLSVWLQGTSLAQRAWQHWRRR